MSSEQQNKYDGWSRDRLITELERVSNEFGLRWDTRQTDRNLEEEQGKNLVVLNHDPALSVGTAPFQNLVIEGDNFDALRYLAVTHRGKVNCIYIDPPYNTGKKDFIYNDVFLDKDKPFRHSKWLGFMNARLQLAKELLAQDGVIFVSIDDNEYHHLKMLMDQVFAGQYIGTFIKRIAGGKNDSIFIKTSHEYLLCYGKADSLRMTESIHENDSTRSLRKDGDNDREQDRPNLYYPIYADPVTSQISVEQFFGAQAIFPVRPDGTPGRWRWKKDTVTKDVAKLVLKKTRGGPLGIYVRASAGSLKVNPWVSLIDDSDTLDTSWLSVLDTYAKGGGTHLKQVLGENAFTYPKNPEYIKWVCSLVKDKNALFMDFFAGSGTTAEAVMQLNTQDGGTRRFICISATEATKDTPNKNICRDVCAIRVSKVISGYSYESGATLNRVAGVVGDFAYFRAKPIPIERVGYDLQDEQIWHALQLSYCPAVVPYDLKNTVQTALTDRSVLAYCKFPGQADAQAALAELAAKHGSVLLFSRKLSSKAQATLAALGNVVYQSVPQELLAMFGVTE